MKIQKGIILLFVASIAVACLSCKKNNGDLPPAAMVPAYLKVVNLTSDTINVYQNGSRINNNTSFNPLGSAGYDVIAAGTQQYQIKKAGSPDVMISLPLSLDSAKTYSLFITGTSADRIFTINDVISNSNDVYIRYVNASPGGVFDVKIGRTINAASIAFKGETAFFKTDTGRNKFQIFTAGNSTPLSEGTLTLVAGRVYTLYTKGTVGATGSNAFAARLLTNK